MKPRKSTPRSYYSSVSPKGQITLPAVIREKLGIKPKDNVRIVEHEKGIFIERMGRASETTPATLATSRPVTVEEMTQLVEDETALEFARRGY